jgi:outer membrane protein insertion porin family
VRITDRFFGQQLRGFDIRGIGPRIRRTQYTNGDGSLAETNNNTVDSLGGRAYYMGRLELEFPTSSGLRSLGIRPSAYIDAGSVFGLRRPSLNNIKLFCTPDSTNTTGASFQIPGSDSRTTCGTGFVDTLGFREEYLGDSPKPRLSVGVGFNWTSPFGPLRIDIAKALLKQEGDDTKLFSFNVGTQF